MKYTIITIVKEAEVQGKFGPQIRTAFTVEGNSNTLSAFTKYPLKVGQEIDGDITQTEKEGRTYHNFSFAKKGTGSSDDMAYIKRELTAIRQEQVMVRQLLQAKGQIAKPDDFATDSTIPYSEEDTSGIPF